MKQISKHEYDQIVEWVEGAKNYAGIASHNVDGTAYCIKKSNGETIVAVEECGDDFSSGTIYLADKEIYRIWKDKFGYSIL